MKNVSQNVIKLQKVDLMQILLVPKPELND